MNPLLTMLYRIAFWGARYTAVEVDGRAYDEMMEVLSVPESASQPAVAAVPAVAPSPEALHGRDQERGKM